MQLFQLQALPRQLIINREQKLSYVGPLLDRAALHAHLERLQYAKATVCDEIKNFRLVKSNVDTLQKNGLIDFLRNVEGSYAETLARCVSWRIDYIDKTNYNVKGDAQRSFAIEIQLITQGEEIEGLTELL